MVKNFWEKLKKPIMVQAPMSGVTDEAFRQMFLKYGRPDVFWTEFVSVDGLFSRGKDYCLDILKYASNEHPIVSQIFGSEPMCFERAAQLVVELGFDGIDINMGCPDRAIEKQGGGAALIKNLETAKEIIRATKRGAGKIPVSVKTRIGYNKNEIDSWIGGILEEQPAVLTVHFRTRGQGYLGVADWQLAKDVLALRDKISPQTLVFGNGDVKNVEQARQLAKDNGLDGVMIGRSLVGNPWFFSGKNPTKEDRLRAVLDRIEIFNKFCKDKHFDSLKKHFHAYLKGFNGAKELRDQLMQSKKLEKAKEILKTALR